MNQPLFLVLCQFAVVGTLLVSGVFLTFSDFLMRSLQASAEAVGIEVMQVINREVMRTLFLSLFFGLVPLLVGLAGYAVYAQQGLSPWLFAAGAVIYVVGVFGVTAVANVPMNNHLEGLAASSQEAADYWRGTYLPRWVWWNSVRTVCSSAAGLCFIAGSAYHLSILLGGR